MKIPETVEKQLKALRKEVDAIDALNHSDQQEIIRLQNLITDRCEKGALASKLLREVEKVVAAFVAQELPETLEPETLEDEALVEETLEDEAPVDLGPPQYGSRPTARDRVIAALRDAQRPMKGKEVFRALNEEVNERTVTSTLTHLKQDGLAQHDPMAATYALNPSP